MLPVYLHGDSPGTEVEGSRRPNRSVAPERCLDRIGSGIEDLFHHVLAVLHDPTYREANAGALRIEWPRMPLPRWSDSVARTAPSLRSLAPSAGATGRATASPSLQVGDISEQAAP